MRGLAASFRFMRDPANREEVIKMVVDTTGSSEAIARQILSLYFDPDRGVVPKQAEIDERLQSGNSSNGGSRRGETTTARRRTVRGPPISARRGADEIVR